MRALLLAVIAAARCPTHKCGVTPAFGLCKAVTGGDYVYSPCPNDTPYCTFDVSGASGKCTPLPPVFKFNGKPCQYPLECLSRTCTDGVCRSHGSLCRFTVDCLPGDRCHSGKCVPLVPAGSSGCTVTTDCDLHSACFEGKCIRYFSQLPGEKTECTVYMTSLLCESGRCAELKCIPKPEVTTQYAAPCFDDYECEVEECFGVEIPAKCICGFSSSNTPHCAVRVTDDAVQEYLDLVQEWLLSESVERCHSSGRYALVCLREHWVEWKVRRLHWLSFMFRYEPFQDLTQCVGDIILRSSLSKNIII